MYIKLPMVHVGSLNEMKVWNKSSKTICYTYKDILISQYFLLNVWDSELFQAKKYPVIFFVLNFLWTFFQLFSHLIKKHFAIRCYTFNDVRMYYSKEDETGKRILLLTMSRYLETWDINKHAYTDINTVSSFCASEPHGECF